MKKNGMKVMAMIGSAVMAAGMLAGCGNSGAAATTAATATTAEQTTEAKAEETTKEAATEAKSADADLSGLIKVSTAAPAAGIKNAHFLSLEDKSPYTAVRHKTISAIPKAAASKTRSIAAILNQDKMLPATSIMHNGSAFKISLFLLFFPDDISCITPAIVYVLSSFLHNDILRVCG